MAFQSTVAVVLGGKLKTVIQNVWLTNTSDVSVCFSIHMIAHHLFITELESVGLCSKSPVLIKKKKNENLTHYPDFLISCFTKPMAGMQLTMEWMIEIDRSRCNLSFVLKWYPPEGQKKLESVRFSTNTHTHAIKTSLWRIKFHLTSLQRGQTPPHWYLLTSINLFLLGIFLVWTFATATRHQPKSRTGTREVCTFSYKYLPRTIALTVDARSYTFIGGHWLILARLRRSRPWNHLDMHYQDSSAYASSSYFYESRFALYL